MNPSNDKATATAVKRALLQHLIGHKNHVVAIEEFTMGEGICDVLSVTQSGFAHDFEVKVERQDLRGELRCAEQVLDGSYLQLTPAQRRWTVPKLFKHECMIKRLKTTAAFPCMFSFVVPIELQELAQPIAERAGYGLVTFCRYEQPGSARLPWYQFRFVIQPKKMHREKFDRWPKVARSICFKHYFGRQEEET